MKRGLLIGFVLFLTLAVLTPVPALAAKPVLFNASGTITAISDGIEKPAGNSGRWVVFERDIKGVMYGDIGGQNGTDYTFSYKANVEKATQAGNLHGTVNAGGKVLNVEGKSQPFELVGWYAPGIPILKLTLNGNWSFTKGAQGQGSWDATVYFIPTPDGHVAAVVGGAFTLTGQWQP